MELSDSLKCFLYWICCKFKRFVQGHSKFTKKYYLSKHFILSCCNI